MHWSNDDIAPGALRADCQLRSVSSATERDIRVHAMYRVGKPSLEIGSSYSPAGGNGLVLVSHSRHLVHPQCQHVDAAADRRGDALRIPFDEVHHFVSTGERVWRAALVALSGSSNE